MFTPYVDSDIQAFARFLIKHDNDFTQKGEIALWFAQPDTATVTTDHHPASSHRLLKTVRVHLLHQPSCDLFAVDAFKEGAAKFFYFGDLGGCHLLT